VCTSGKRLFTKFKKHYKFNGKFKANSKGVESNPVRHKTCAVRFGLARFFVLVHVSFHEEAAEEEKKKRTGTIWTSSIFNPIVSTCKLIGSMTSQGFMPREKCLSFFVDLRVGSPLFWLPP